MNYISFIDVLGTKNSTENENYEEYIKYVVNFQYSLIENSSMLKGKGRVHFFSDCAYIESTNLQLLVKYVLTLRTELLQSDLFLRGSIIEGKLVAINGEESENDFKKYYNDSKLTARFKSLKNTILSNKEVINGTMFLGNDISKAYFYENSLKACAIFVEPKLIDKIPDKSAKSGYIRDMAKLDYSAFYDLKYDPDFITDAFIRKIMHHYSFSNSSDVTYGRYYLSILLTCINSIDFSNLSYNKEANEFKNHHVLFDLIISLRKKYSNLYSKTIGLEYLFFTFLNKIYEDIGENNLTTKQLVLLIFQNKKYLSKFENKMTHIPKDVLSLRNRNMMLKDYHELIKEELI